MSQLLKIRQLDDDPQFKKADELCDRLHGEIRSTQQAIENASRQGQRDLDAEVQRKLQGLPSEPAKPKARVDVDELHHELEVLQRALKVAEEERSKAIEAFKKSVAAELRGEYPQYVKEHLLQAFQFMDSIRRLVTITDEMNRAGAGLDVDRAIIPGTPIRFSYDNRSAFYLALKNMMGRIIPIEELAKLMNEHGASMAQIRGIVMDYHNMMGDGVLSVSEEDVKKML